MKKCFDSVFFDAEYKNEKKYFKFVFISVKTNHLTDEKKRKGLRFFLVFFRFFKKIISIEKMVMFFERSVNVSTNEKSNDRESSGEQQQQQ